MNKTITALLGTATVANATIVHLFENEDITVRVQVNNSRQLDETTAIPSWVDGAKMQVEVTSTSDGVRLNSVYWRANHGALNNMRSDIKSFDLVTDDFTNGIRPDPNPFGFNEINPAFRPYLFPDEGRGSYNFSDNRILQQDLNAVNNWFDDSVDGGDQFFLFSDTFRQGSGSIGEHTFAELPMSFVYSKEQGSTVRTFSLGNFSEIYDFDDAGRPVEEPSVPEPSAALLTILAALGTLRRKRTTK